MSYICILLCWMHAFHLWIEFYSINFIKILFNEEQVYCLSLTMKYLHRNHREVLNKAFIVCKMHKIEWKMRRKALNTWIMLVQYIQTVRPFQIAVNFLGTISIEDLKSSCIESIERSDKWLQDKWLSSKKLWTDKIQFRIKD